MSLLFRYKILQTKGTVPSLGGRSGRPFPLITITLVGPTGVSIDNALLDTGSMDTVFSERVATAIGIDLTHAPTGLASGVGGGIEVLRFAPTKMRITDGREFREWTGWIGYTSAHLNFPLLGFAGFLQFFSAHFHGDREEVELTVNSLYPGI